MKAKTPGRFTIKATTHRNHGFTNRTFTLCGYVQGRRIRCRFEGREPALGEQNSLEVLAARLPVEMATVRIPK
jgi:hypothetical protein